ncbi:fumarylacetoacetate hydrolase family protein [Tsukamurella sp. M9C]|uniref:fumarylacetoacetate hydrolase family protein n=1 Tax=Tsukamurella sp. M9C TaxID=2877520 RepID=UPI001CC95454|nr:fumarylacetoacetate hydrolase family protein [Tsukamurella sp. M9C]MCA0157447.1 fumarylacetoacetate hydrolase family protein [Tsukamurella sp. M9C]
MRLATHQLGDRTVATADAGSGPRCTGAASVDDLLRRDDWRAVARRAAADGEPLPPSARPLQPVLSPGKVLCCGLNYRAHIEEMGRGVPEEPTFFAKWADTLVGPDADVVLDAGDTEKLDWEAELAVVVGADLRRASVDECAAAIAGYTVSNDVSLRDRQWATTQWLSGKAWDATTPVGPAVVTADAFDPAEHTVTCRVDGETVQRAPLDDLLFSAAELLHHAARFTRLRPGDLILTGTPAGVGAGREPQRFLTDGQVLETEISGIGLLRNTIRITA